MDYAVASCRRLHCDITGRTCLWGFWFWAHRSLDTVRCPQRFDLDQSELFGSIIYLIVYRGKWRCQWAGVKTMLMHQDENSAIKRGLFELVDSALPTMGCEFDSGYNGGDLAAVPLTSIIRIRCKLCSESHDFRISEARVAEKTSE